MVDKQHVKLEKWGNDLAFKIPDAVAKEAELEKIHDFEISVTVTKEGRKQFVIVEQAPDIKKDSF